MAELLDLHRGELRAVGEEDADHVALVLDHPALLKYK